MSLVTNPVVANLVAGPIDRTAANPSISFGGDEINNSGTGIYGTYGQINFAVNGVAVLSIGTNITISGTGGAFITPSLSTAQRDALTAVKGMLIYNSTTDTHQGYNGSWNDLY